MRDRRWTKLRRDFTLHLPRTILVAAAMSVSLAGAGIVLVSWALVRRATIEGYEVSDPPVATLRLDSVPASAVAVARRVPGVRDAEARRTLELPLLVQGTWRPALVFAADHPESVRLGRLSRDSGEWPPPLGTFAIERSSVEFAGTGLSDTVYVTSPDTATRPIPVRGIVRDVGLAPGWMEHLVYAWTSTATLASLGLQSTPDQLRLAVTDAHPTRAEVTRIVRDVSTALAAAGHPVRSADIPEPGEHIHAGQMNSLLMTQGTFGVLALLVGAFLVVNLMAAVLAGEIRQVGIMKTLGASDRTLLLMYLAVAAVVGMLSTTIALPVALTLGRRYAMMRGDMLNFDVATYATPWWAVALLVATGIAIPVIAAWFPVRNGVRMTVAAALRDYGLGPDDPARASSAGTSSLWGARFANAGALPRLFALSVRNAFRRKHRMRLTLLTLASGGAVFVATGSLKRAVVGSLDLMFGSQRYTFSTRFVASYPADSLEAAAAAVSGVSGAEAWPTSRAVIEQSALVSTTLPIVGVPLNTRLLDLRVMSGGCTPFGTSSPGDTVSPAGTASTCGGVARPLVVNRATLREFPALAVGDTLALVIGGTRATWTVTGIFDGSPAPQAYTTEDALLATAPGLTRATLVVASGDASLPLRVDLITRVRSALGAAGYQVAGTQLVEEARRVTEDHLLMVVQFLGAMAWVMMLVGGMGLASTMGLAVLERSREIGVMRAIGAGHGTLFTALQAEGLTIALLGWLLAVPLSLPVTVALGAAFSRIMFRVPVQWWPHLPSVGVWLMLAVGISVVACAWPALRAMRMPVARALAHDG